MCISSAGSAGSAFCGLAEGLAAGLAAGFGVAAGLVWPSCCAKTDDCAVIKITAHKTKCLMIIVGAALRGRPSLNSSTEGRPQSAAPTAYAFFLILQQSPFAPCFFASCFPSCFILHES